MSTSYFTCLASVTRALFQDPLLAASLCIALFFVLSAFVMYIWGTYKLIKLFLVQKNQKKTLFTIGVMIVLFTYVIGIIIAVITHILGDAIADNYKMDYKHSTENDLVYKQKL